MTKHPISQASVILILVTAFLSQPLLAKEFEPHSDSETHNFTLSSVTGETQSLSDYQGKVVLINFWASWCLPCVEEMPELVQLRQHISSQSFKILMINVGENKHRVIHFTERMNFELPILLDTSNKVFDSWKVKTMPTSFLVDSSGNVRYRAIGNPGWFDEQTLSILENLIKETEKPGNDK